MQQTASNHSRPPSLSLWQRLVQRLTAPADARQEGDLDHLLREIGALGIDCAAMANWRPDANSCGALIRAQNFVAAMLRAGTPRDIANGELALKTTLCPLPHGQALLALAMKNTQADCTIGVQSSPVAPAKVSRPNQNTHTQPPPAPRRYGNAPPNQLDITRLINAVHKVMLDTPNKFKGKQRLEQLRRQALSSLPDGAVIFDTAMRQVRLRQQAVTESIQNGFDSAGCREALNQLRRDKLFPRRLMEKTEEDAHYQSARAARRRDAQTRQREGRPLSDVRANGVSSPPILNVSAGRARAPAKAGGAPPHRNPRDHGIHTLKPSQKWRLVIDETGDRWDGSADEASLVRMGRAVAVLIPVSPTSGQPLIKALPATWHAIDQHELRAIDDVIQAIIDAPVGILGFPVTHSPRLRKIQRWAPTVLQLLAWVLRLLPIDGPTHVDVEIENFPGFDSGENWNVAALEMVRQMSRHDGSRFENLSISVKIVGKGASEYVPYADALAFTWSRAAEHSAKRLTQTGLLGTCLLDIDPEVLRDAYDALVDSEDLSGDLWCALIASADSGAPNSLARSLLDRLAAACRTDVPLWHRYLAEVHAHLESKAIDLPTLIRQTEWLRSSAPPHATLPKKMLLAWCSARLTQATHLGQVNFEPDVDLDSLLDSLRLEDVRTVCEIDLRRAVLASNAFDFVQQRAILRRWEDVATETVGLQLWGRIRSSIGQYHAFVGELDAAIHCFRQAIDAFRVLADESLAHAESRHTGTYLAIAEMDRGSADALAAVEKVTGFLDAKRIAELAGDDDPASKYIHYLLLRYLAHCRDEQRSQWYLASRENWNGGEGHPWPLIDLYRGLLLRGINPQAAVEHLLRAYAVAAEQGPTVQLVGAAAAAILCAWGEHWCGAENTLSQLEKELSRASDRVTMVREYMASPGGDELKFLARVLPFNFR